MASMTRRQFHIHKWRAKFGGMDAPMMTRLRQYCCTASEADKVHD